MIAALFALTGAGILINWWRLARPLWVDEEMLSLNVRDRAFSELGGPLWLDQAAPFGWLALERIALLIGGTGERAMRALPILFGLGTIAVCVWIGRRWMTPFGAAVLVVLCSIGQWLVFFTLELKHYSADTFWALFLPGLAAWAIEALEVSTLRRRLLIWWIAAAGGQWLSNGAMFVTPACAVIIITHCWRRQGWRFGVSTAASGIVWVGAFLAHYWIMLRHVLANPYLKNYWAFAFPPVGGGALESLRWLMHWFEPFAVKPGGSTMPLMFWSAVLAGFAFSATRTSVGLLYASVPASAIVLAYLRVVPPIERLALWVVPALYVGIAMCADFSVSLWNRWRPEKRVLALAGAAAATALSVLVTHDVFQRGQMELRYRPISNYRLDDRSSIRFVMALHRPGDLIMTTHFGLAGLWWYGGIDISEPEAGGRLPDSSPLYEVGHAQPGARCDGWKTAMDDIFRNHSRAIVYLGFRMNVEPPGFENLIMQELNRRGALVGYRQYAEDSLIAAFDLTRTSEHPFIPPLGPDPAARKIPAPEGCVAIRPARRW